MGNEKKVDGETLTYVVHADDCGWQEGPCTCGRRPPQVAQRCYVCRKTCGPPLGVRLELSISCQAIESSRSIGQWFCSYGCACELLEDLATEFGAHEELRAECKRALREEKA